MKLCVLVKSMTSSEDQIKKNLQDYRKISRKQLAGICTANKVCDGNSRRTCMGQHFGGSIGFGGAGQGMTFDANYKALEKYKLKTRLIKPHLEPKMDTTFLGHPISFPVMLSSVSGVRISMNDVMPELEFQRNIIIGAQKSGTIGLSGNTVDFPDHIGLQAIQEVGGYGIPVFKPQEQERLLQLFQAAEQANALAIGVDLDGCGSTNWEYRGKPVYRKGPKELIELVDSTSKPVFFKGIMSVEDASAVLDSGAQALDVSNHGGRVLDHGQGVAEVLPEIVEYCQKKITIMADGAVRTGYDVLKLLALGADTVLIGRPLARMALAGGIDAVTQYLTYVQGDLRRAMLLTGCDTLQEISADILVKSA